jgi:hypothetical protein
VPSQVTVTQSVTVFTAVTRALLLMGLANATPARRAKDRIEERIVASRSIFSYSKFEGLANRRVVSLLIGGRMSVPAAAKVDLVKRNVNDF